MKEFEVKNVIDLDKIGVLTREDRFTKEEVKMDYLMDEAGNYIYPLSPLEFKLIEKIKDLENRIKKLEGK